MRFDTFFGAFSRVRAAKRRLQAIKSGDDTVQDDQPPAPHRQG
jgi:hypothetical protein